MAEPGLEEMLELIWTMKEEADKVEKDLLIKKLKLPGAENMLKTLIHENFVKITDTKVELTNKGMTDARLIIRRHRLAERLLNDVLAVKEDTMDSSACKFEHFLDEEVTTSICTCPHRRHRECRRARDAREGAAAEGRAWAVAPGRRLHPVDAGAGEIREPDARARRALARAEGPGEGARRPDPRVVAVVPGARAPE